MVSVVLAFQVAEEMGKADMMVICELFLEIGKKRMAGLCYWFNGCWIWRCIGRE